MLNFSDRIALRIKKVDEEAKLWDKIQEFILDIYNGIMTIEEAEEQLDEEHFDILLGEL